MSPTHIPEKPLSARRARYGQWMPYAERLVLFVEKGWGVSEAIRYIIKEQGVTQPHAFNGIRGAYYLLKKS